MNWINFYGLVIMILLLIPNIHFGLTNKNIENKCNNKVMNLLEQVGRYGTMLLMVFHIGILEFGFQSNEEFSLWLIIEGILIVLYWICWFLYYKAKHIVIALMLAIIPSIIFISSGIFLRHWLLVIFGIVFFIGHVFVSYENARGDTVTNSKHNLLKIIYLCSILTIIISVIYYRSIFDQDLIYKNVRNQKGYELYEIEKPIHFSCNVNSEWIPAKENDVIQLDKVIGKVGNVEILLENVMHRGNDIFFNFDAIPYIKYDKGEFLANYIFNNDGTATTYNLMDSFRVYNKKGRIDVGQKGFGPMSKVSFGIDIENYDQIVDGFTVDYNGSILYGYVKQDNP